MKYEDIIKNYKEEDKIRIYLKNRFFYSGKIKRINSDSLVILDKFQQLVTIDFCSVEVIAPINNHGEQK